MDIDTPSSGPARYGITDPREVISAPSHELRRTETAGPAAQKEQSGSVSRA